MTSAQPMQPLGVGALARSLWVALATGVLVIGGCLPQRGPEILESPYARNQLWAVAPFVNESGNSTVDSSRLADLFAQQAQHVNGIDSGPVNRVVFAMRQLGLEAVATQGDALSLMSVLEVDGLIVGTVTAYDPYPPLTLGVAVQLYRMLSEDQTPRLDPRALIRSTRDTMSRQKWEPSDPTAQAAGVFNAANHQTLERLSQYAGPRSVPDSAYGTDIYLVSMELYTQFVSYQLIRDLLVAEQRRLMPIAPKQLTRR